MCCCRYMLVSVNCVKSDMFSANVCEKVCHCVVEVLFLNHIFCKSMLLSCAVLYLVLDHILIVKT